MVKSAYPQPLIQIISEQEFLPFVQETCREFFRVYNLLKTLVREEADFTKKFYAHLFQNAEILETFLDEHGARDNRTWFFFSEAVASIRNLGMAAFFIQHLLDRYPLYNLIEPDPNKERFYADARGTLEFLNQSILNLFRAAVKTGQENGLILPADSISLDEFREIQSNKQLPKNVSEEQVKDEDERVIDLCEKISKAAELMGKACIGQTDDLVQLKKLNRETINEKSSRMFNNLIHSVQSEFDTYIKNTQMMHKHEYLKHLRDYAVLSLHLQEVVLWLSHFYERHEDDIRQGECRAQISNLVDKAELLKKIINFAFYYSNVYIREGANLCEKILPAILKTVRYEVPIPQPHGFHARPSTYISLIARKHETDVFLILDEEKYNVKSVMSLLQAGGMIADKGDQTVIFEGDKRALDDIRILASHNYCEDSDLPPQLNYLRDLRTPA